MIQFLGKKLHFRGISIAIFSSPIQMYRKSYCTMPGIGVGVGSGGGGGGVDKMLKVF